MDSIDIGELRKELEKIESLHILKDINNVLIKRIKIRVERLKYSSKITTIVGLIRMLLYTIYLTEDGFDTKNNGLVQNEIQVILREIDSVKCQYQITLKDINEKLLISMSGRYCIVVDSKKYSISNDRAKAIMDRLGVINLASNSK